MRLRRQVFDDERNCIAHYGSSVVMVAPATNLTISQVYSLNGLFQIDQTAAAGTPWQWAAITAVYNKYVVMRARYIVTFYDPTGEGAIVGVQIHGPGVAGLTAAQVLLRPKSGAKQICTSGEQQAIFKGNIDLPLLYGESRATYRANYGALVTANPGAGSPNYTLPLQLYALSTVGGATNTVKVTALFEFETIFFDMVI